LHFVAVMLPLSRKTSAIVRDQVGDRVTAHEEISKVGPLSPQLAAALMDLRRRERRAGALEAPVPNEIRELLPSDDVVDRWFDVLPAATVTGKSDRQARRSRRAARTAQPKRS
jgi:hypothetical protein